MTNREIVSNIRSTHRLLSSDGTINDRVVLSEARNAAVYLVKQQTDKRKLYGSPNLFTLLPCVEMEEAPLSECCDFTSTWSVAKTKRKIPRIAEGIYGMVVQQVSGVDDMEQFVWVTPRRLSNILSLGIPKNKVYWMMKNGHIYVTNAHTKAVNITAFFEEDVPASLLYSTIECDCKPNPSIEEICMNPMDREFKCPGFLLDAVSKMVSQKLLNTYFRVKQDTSAEGMDEQAPNINK